uniref:Uncharacterized protein n=1 Tax=Syphacia muris TaxID=451379 RepID=A0A0N5AFW5_9BILA
MDGWMNGWMRKKALNCSTKERWVGEKRRSSANSNNNDAAARARAASAPTAPTAPYASAAASAGGFHFNAFQITAKKKRKFNLSFCPFSLLFLFGL